MAGVFWGMVMLLSRGAPTPAGEGLLPAGVGFKGVLEPLARRARFVQA